jgi:small subunit ribosomal protein S17
MEKQTEKQNEISNGSGRLMKGTVVSDKMNKTVVVAVTRLKEHPKYRKRYKVTSRYKAHDENNEFKTGDLVMIREARPLSKDKRWVVEKIVKKAGVEDNGNSEKE